jgi:WD40 repeat protein/tRNA A-37 threonylcarbamoyl transferase component Bud32
MDRQFEQLVELGSDSSIDAELEKIAHSDGECARKLRGRIQAWRALRGFCDELAKREGSAAVDAALRPASRDALVEQLLEEVVREGDDGRRLTREAPIATGGMARIVEVWDTALQRPLAMKVLAFERATADPVRMRRFIDEARITGGLDHPSIVPVHHFGLDGDGQLFFTMRRVEGRTLREVFGAFRSGDQAWTLVRVVRVLQQVCDALAFAHSRGFAHRDLKPANVMVGQFGDVYVLDWGVARQIGSSESTEQHGVPIAVTRSDRSDLHTVAGSVLGTPNYMSPEQAQGEPSIVDARFDVYALGAILYELLTGRVPYSDLGSGSADHALDRVLAGPPTPIAIVAPGANAELTAIAEKAMSREPSLRYADASALSDDLRAWLEVRVVRAHRTGALAELSKWVRRNRAVAIVALAALLVITVGSTAFATWTKHKNSELATARRGAEHREMLARTAKAASDLRDGNIVQARRSLDAIAEQDRAWEWRHLNARADSSERIVYRADSEILDVALDPTRAFAAVACASGTVDLIAVDSGERRRRLGRGESPARSIAWLADGIRLLVGRGDGTLELWNCDGTLLDLSLPDGVSDIGLVVEDIAASDDGSVAMLALQQREMTIGSAPHYVSVAIEHDRLRRDNTGPAGKAYSARFLAGSHDVLLTTAAIGKREELGVFDPQERREIVRLGEHDERVYDIALHPDGLRFATCSWDHSIAMWHLGNKLEVWRKTQNTRWTRDQPVTHLAFSDDGSKLASGGWDDAVYIRDSATGNLLAQRWGHLDRVTFVGFSRDGRLLSASLDGTLRAWPLDGAAGLRRIAHPYWVTSLAFSPDGRSIATCGRSYEIGPDGAVVDCAQFGSHVRIIDVESGAIVREMPAFPSPCGSVDWSRDGKWIAASQSQYPLTSPEPWPHAIAIWDTHSGKRVPDLCGHETSVVAVAFDPESKRLASTSLDRTIRIWNVATWSCERVLRGHEDGRIVSVQFSPNGKQLLSTSFDSTVRIWNVETGECELVFGGHAHPVRAARWSPDGRRIASCAAECDHTVHTEAFVWDARTGVIELELRGHEQGILAIAWNRDGTRLATSSEDATIRIWDAASGDALLTLVDAEGWIGSLQWSADGRTLASGGGDGILRLWTDH